ncbi:hypothetical protein [Streptomyces sp. BP-8]|uniref:Uncharacterized protein n=1 Tax=Streptomyces sirii TaxID=3127701 RepID=A0ABZ2QYW4_9ACTN
MPQRLLMYGSSVALAAGGVLIPGDALTAAAMPHHAAASTVAAGINIPAVEWAEVTDPPSGVTARLPGEVKVTESNDPHCRMYSALTADTHVVFAVCDLPETPTMEGLHETAKGGTDSFRKNSGNVAIKSSTRETEFDGHPTLELRLSTKEGGPDSPVGAFRYIADDSRVIAAETVAYAQNEKSLNSTHKQLIAGIRIPD